MKVRKLWRCGVFITLITKSRMMDRRFFIHHERDHGFHSVTVAIGITRLNIDWGI